MARMKLSLTVSAALAGWLAMAVVVSAQHSHGQHRTTLGERFGRLRRSLLGDDEQAPTRQPVRVARTPHRPEVAQPHLAEDTDLESDDASDSLVDEAPAPLTRQSASKAQASAKRPVSPWATSSNGEPSHDDESDTGKAAAGDGDAEDGSSRRPLIATHWSPGRPTLAPAKSVDPSASERSEVEETSDDTTAPATDKRAATAKSPATPPADRTRKHGHASGDPRLLFSRATPLITLRGSGPRRLAVGQAANYSISLSNDGDQPASDVSVKVKLPEWIELASSKPTAGKLENNAGELHWSVRGLSPGNRETLSLKLVAHEGRNCELEVRLDADEVGAKTSLEVRQPLIELKIEGATQVVCGGKEVYRLSVSNPGTGPAENVTLQLLPLTSDDGEMATHRIGTIGAGESKTVEIELVARQSGVLNIQARATADGGLKAAASEEVMVRQPGVRVEVVGPARQYVGATATYQIHLKNPGDAPARKVKLLAVLPGNAECVSAGQQGKLDTKHKKAAWSIAELDPGADLVFSLKCIMRQSGENRLEVTATADGDLSHSNLAVTDVVAVADLVLDVSDPSGAIAVGEDAVYEVRVRNRGNEAAEGVDVVAYFSDGVEPVSVEGRTPDVASGTVTFGTIPTLAAGKELVFKIHAKARQGGTHRVRVELECRSLGTKLTEEETTLFYADDAAPATLDDVRSTADAPSNDRPHLATPPQKRTVR
jgi:uncharacterized repeat protein (TIGR01451 family)